MVAQMKIAVLRVGMSEMHRRGHTGIAMLAYAPVAYIFLRGGQPALALGGLLGVLCVEPVPDNDFWLPGLRHRGISHSLLGALVVGSLLGVGGWLLAAGLNGLLARPVATLVSLPMQIDDSIVGELIGLFHTLDSEALAGLGFAVGVFGVLVHLLGDVITVAGIRPFLPVSSRRVSLSPLRSHSPTANSVLFGLGILALVVVVVTAAPGVLSSGIGVPQGCPLASGPSTSHPNECVPSFDLSPVGVAAGQSANETNASVAFANQTSNGTNVTVESVTLPEGGFIAIHSSGYTTGAASAESSIIATSKYLKPGNYSTVTIDISNAPPGNYPGLNRSRLNASEPLTAMIHRDTDGNERMDFIASVGANDTAYTIDGSPVADSAGVTVPTETREQASVSVRNQTVQSDSVTIESARLPDGGFLVVHNDSYLPPESAPLESAVGVTSYLEAGQHNGVSVPLLDGAVEEDQQLIAVPYRDTNGNQRYDYIASDGFQDTAYENRTGNQSVIVNDMADVAVEGTESATESRETSTATPVDTTTSFKITNLSVSNRTAHVGDEVTVTARITNPRDSRLDGELALATAGEAVETQQVALFAQESRTVTFTHSYDAAGEYVIKVGDHTQRIRIVEEGAPLTPMTTTGEAGPANANNSESQAAKSDSGGSLSLTDIILLVVLVSIFAGLIWALFTLRKRI